MIQNMESKLNSRIDRIKMSRAIKIAKWSIYFFIFCLCLSGVFNVYNFITDHKFRSPIIFQVPFYKDDVKLKSGVSKKKVSLVPQADAEEIQNPYDSKSPQGIAWEIIKNKWGTDQWNDFETLVDNESSWNPYNVNPSSGACGIPQALPCSKMPCERWDTECQINWMANYIVDHGYGTPKAALAFWNTKHLIEGRWVNYY